MKAAHIVAPLIGAIPDIYLTAAQDEQWQNDRIEAFEQACASAVKHEAAMLLITGGLFADNYVTDEVITRTLDIIGAQPCPVVWLPDSAGNRYLRYKENIPENFFLVNGSDKNVFEFEDIRITVWSEETKPSGNCGILLLENERTGVGITADITAAFPELRYAVCSDKAFIRANGGFREEQLSKIENTGFDDPENSGYYILKLENGRIKGRSKVAAGIYRFRTVQVDVETGDDFKSVYRKCALAAAELTRHDFVRIILNGSVDMESFVRAEQLRDELKARFFCLDVINNCRLELDEEAFAGDISLKSEYIRIILADDMLSETEKSRIIQCGWNALRGKELSE